MAPDFFRREYARLVGLLVLRFGGHRLAMAEDSAQSALAAAVIAWPKQGQPACPEAWLTTAAKRRMIDALRRESASDRAHARLTAEPQAQGDEAWAMGAQNEEQAQLSMLCLCCDPKLGSRSQMVLALKVVCGFGIEEIALRLFLSRASVQKRLERAREQLAQRWSGVAQEGTLGLQARYDGLSAQDLAKRSPAVLRLLYLLFNEGYASTRAKEPLRRELCQEALRLTSTWVKRSDASGAGKALLALMHFHLARMEGRMDAQGRWVLMEHQDRSRWDRRRIAQGLTYLGEAIQDDEFSRYHAEAGIAAQHCLAPTFKQTNWQEIDDLYAILYAFIPSPVYLLSRAICHSHLHSPAKGLEMLASFRVPSWLEGYYLWPATLGELHRRAGHRAQAKKLLRAACKLAPEGQDRAMIQARLLACDAPPDEA